MMTAVFCCIASGWQELGSQRPASFFRCMTHQVDRIHQGLKSESAKQTDEWMFSELQGDVQRGKSENKLSASWTN
ncbi:hypothetical protein [Neisseria wadsworthii]|uniref:hypothetical protein n=1 Tax=Neisseria wadsworthii TaxID=607711 RepID=UPI0012EAE1C4|nr:hypothetical protein [Neisseria wadsworthii]QMT35951.1 hypothetical protein H3L96_01430 [Neisseria wadsworthii]